MVEVDLLGCGGMQPLQNRSLTACLISHKEHRILIDAGEGTQVQLKKTGKEAKKIETICLTHFHSDHVLGLPGILLMISNAERTEPVTILGPSGLKEVFRHLCYVIPQLGFEVILKEFTELTEVYDTNDYVITAFQVNHSVSCYGYTFYAKRSRRIDFEKAEKYNVPKARIYCKQEFASSYSDIPGIIVQPAS